MTVKCSLWHILYNNASILTRKMESLLQKGPRFVEEFYEQNVTGLSERQ